MFQVIATKLNEDYIYILDKKWSVEVLCLTTKESRTVSIARLACGFDCPKLSELIEKIESASSWEEIYKLDRSSAL